MIILSYCFPMAFISRYKCHCRKKVMSHWWEISQKWNSLPSLRPPSSLATDICKIPVFLGTSRRPSRDEAHIVADDTICSSSMTETSRSMHFHCNMSRVSERPLNIEDLWMIYFAVHTVPQQPLFVSSTTAHFQAMVKQAFLLLRNRLNMYKMPSRGSEILKLKQQNAGSEWRRLQYFWWCWYHGGLCSEIRTVNDF